jgi:hypothetical protein
MFPLNPSFLSVVACAAAGLSGLLAACGAVCVRGSTAVPAAVWAVAACLAFAGEMAARAAGGLSDPAAAAAVRLGVVSLSLCPALSLLGAKRPQHGVWQLIVGTLAVVLVMPAASALLMRPGSLPDVHLVERCFMPLLVLVGWLNFAGTRRLAAVTGIAGAELLLMRGFLPGMAVDWAPTGVNAAIVDAVAAGLLLSGTLLAMLQALLSRAGRAKEVSGTDPQRDSVAAIIDPPFLALRETLGAAWTLRIAERFDTVAADRGWPCRLRFGGLETVGGLPETSSQPVWQRDALRAFQALLRRFVSVAWLTRHGWPRGAVDGPHAEPLA